MEGPAPDPGDLAPAARQVAALLRTMVARAPVGFALFDTGLRFVLVNECLAAINGRPAEDHVGCTLEEVAPNVADQVRPLLQRVLDTAEVVADTVVSVERSTATGARRVWRDGYFPVVGDDGTVLGVGAVVVEVTDEERARGELEHANALLRLAHRTSRSGAYQWRPPEGTVEWTPEYRLLYGFGPHVEGSFDTWITAVHPQDRSWLITDTADALANGDGWHNTFRIVHPDRGVRWIESISGIERAPDGSPLRITGINLDVTDRVRAETELARLNELQRRIAYRLQEAMLPQRLPTVAGLQVAARHVAGADELRVGGDWYDVIEVEPGGVALVIGDVVGHDIEAAIAMGQIRNAIGGLSFAVAEPSDVLRRLDELTTHQPQLRYTTLGYGRLQVASGHLRYATAGHPPPLVIRRDGAAWYFQGGRSGSLGLDPVVRREASLVLQPGDTLVLYTDGLVERREAGIDHGLQRLLAASVGAPDRSVDELADHLVHELTSSGAPGGDDIALLVARIR